MSATIGAALSAVSQALGFTLRPGSFRGVPFFTDEAGGKGGRRLVVHEFPLRDHAATEDMGRQPRVFRISAFVIGPGYQALRDRLLDALEQAGAPGVLVHYTMGEITCAVGGVSFSEHKSAGGYCEFQIEFVRAGPQPSPVGPADTASALLAAVASLLPLISAAYEAVQLASINPQALLEGAAETMLGLPPDTIGGLQSIIGAVPAAPADQAATASAVQAATQAMASAIIATATVTPAPDDPVAGNPFLIATPADPSGGLLGLSGWGAALPAVTGAGPFPAAVAAQQAAVIALVAGNATAALAQVYASVDWPDAQAADQARSGLLAALDAQAEAAADAGQDDLWRGWEALTALAMADMIARAQGLPVLGAYTTGAPLPAVALAQRLYLDPSRADQLADLNRVPQPLFMPGAGVALSA